MPLNLSLIQSRFDTKPVSIELADMSEMVAWFTALAERPIAIKTDNQLVLPATYDGEGRKKANIVTATSQFWFDFDGSSQTPEAIADQFDGIELAAYPTSKPDCFRVIIAASRPMTVVEYEHLSKLWQAGFLAEDPECGFDPASCVAGQPFYLPANGSVITHRIGGVIDVDGLLAENPIPVPVYVNPAPARGRPANESWIDDVRAEVLSISSGFNGRIYGLCIKMLNACGKDKARALAEMSSAISQRGSKIEKHINNAKGIFAKLH